MALLKQKAKVGIASKTRKSFEHADVFQRFQQPDGTVRQEQVVQIGPEGHKEARRVTKIIKPKIIEKYDEEMKK